MIRHPDYINRLFDPLIRSGYFSAYAPLVGQVARFGIVGLSAAAIHFSTVMMLVQYFAMQPLVANILGFCVAFQMSYWGHRLWTFNAGSIQHSDALPRLIAVQIGNLVANEALFYTFLRMHIPYQLALLIVLTTLPIFTFLLNKFWVFR